MLIELLTGCVGDCCLCVLFYGGLCEVCVDRVLLYSIEMCFYLFSTGRGYVVPVQGGLDIVLRLLLRYCWSLLIEYLFIVVYESSCCCVIGHVFDCDLVLLSCVRVV